MSAERLKVFLGRMCPIHLGHEVVIDAMIRSCSDQEKPFVMLGSSNTPMSHRHFFSYLERQSFIKARFPNIPILPIPDYHNDEEWLAHLDNTLGAFGIKPHQVTFFGGCEEDLYFFSKAGRAVEIMNRFDGTTPKISATEVRDALMFRRPLESLMSDAVRELVVKIYYPKLEAFVRK